ncbi:hypothetical protein [Planococcus beigongshangi]|uniref:hypothetical protein n=1 Tax=Planococcus beigongshangi TaxID=2782536 RepID=UPI00193B366A|nr:hypothetical protein [Planococcus beigongshangi]
MNILIHKVFLKKEKRSRQEKTANPIFETGPAEKIALQTGKWGMQKVGLAKTGKGRRYVQRGE